MPRKLIPFLSALILLSCNTLSNATSTAPTSTPSQPITTPQTEPAANPTPTPETTTLPEPTASTIATDIPAFPGAEGFGAIATGGRGGQVLYVATLNPDPGGEVEGSLNWALRQEGPRTIVFKVSGVIDAYANIVHGDVTIAGQTSPGGIIVRGLVCDGHYERNDCSNIIIRHIRSRPAPQFPSTDPLDDALRLDGLNRFIIDHGSFANATDEAIQISWASDGTIQNSILAETVGEHFDRGGMLINYSHSDFPQDRLSIIRNMWHRIGGRLPELDCELSGYPDEDAERPSDCAAHPLNIEISNNLLWDPGLPLWYNAAVDPGGDLGQGIFNVNLNYVGNYAAGRPGYGQPLVLSEILNQPGNALFVSGNQMAQYPNYADYDLFYCCNDFNENNPNTDFGVAQRLDTRHAFPEIVYLPANQMVAYMIGNVGAFPRDPMDMRYINSLITNVVDTTPLDRPGGEDALALGFDPANPPPAPIDTDSDGMPDDWETANGLNPNSPDGNNTSLSMQFTGIEGYTNLECYLNQLSDSIVTGMGGP